MDWLQKNEHTNERSLTMMDFHGQVLLAEDDENNQQLLTLYLSKMGVQVTHAENGAVAVTLASKRHFDLIIMDMQMPVLSGIDAVRQLRAAGYVQPIVALTADAATEDREQCLVSGCNAFLVKPITRENLYRIMAQFMAPITPAQPERDARVEPLYSILAEQGPEFTDIVCQFIIKLPDLIDTIEAKYRTRDWAAFRVAVHNLKGTGGGFGFPQLTEHAAEIEQLIFREDYAAIEQLIAALQHLAQRIHASLPQASALDDHGAGGG